MWDILTSNEIFGGILFMMCYIVTIVLASCVALTFNSTYKIYMLQLDLIEPWN